MSETKRTGWMKLNYNNNKIHKLFLIKDKKRLKMMGGGKKWGEKTRKNACIKMRKRKN